MSYIKIELEFLSHPKTVTVSPLAQLLFLRSIIYSGKHQTDGVLPAGIHLLLGYDFSRYHTGDVDEEGRVQYVEILSIDDFVKELVDIGWWEPRKDGRWMIHDYLKHQLSKAEIHQLIENKRIAGQAGGRAAARARAIADTKQVLEQDTSNGLAEAQQNPSYLNLNLNPNLNPNLNLNSSPPTPSLIKSVKTKSARKVLTEFPVDWVMTEEQIEQARALGHNPLQLFAKFRDHYIGNGKRMKDWPATWRNWTRREAEMKEGRR